MNYKHFIRIDKNNNVIKTFSTAFEQPAEGDILMADTNERHFNLDLFTFDGLPKKKWDGEKIVDRTENEIYSLDILKQKKVDELRNKKRAEIIEALIDADTDYQSKKSAVEKAKTKSALDKIG